MKFINKNVNFDIKDLKNVPFFQKRSIGSGALLILIITIRLHFQFNYYSINVDFVLKGIVTLCTKAHGNN